MLPYWIKMKTYLLWIVSILLFQSCATFKPINPEQSALNKSNFHVLNGRYDANSTEHLEQFNSFEYQNFLREIDRKILRDTLNFDSTKSYQFELKTLSEKELQVTYFANNETIRKRVIKTKWKNDGFLYLKNKNIKFSWIPYLLGGLRVKRTRIKLNEDQDLVFDVSQFQGGAAFFIIFPSWNTNRYTKTYERLK